MGRKSPSSEKKDVVVKKRFFFFFFHFSVRCCNTTTAAAEAELCRYTIPNPQRGNGRGGAKVGREGEKILPQPENIRKREQKEREGRGGRRKNERLRFSFLWFILHNKIA